MARGAVGGVVGVLEGDDPVVSVGEGLGAFSVGLVGFEVEEVSKLAACAAVVAGFDAAEGIGRSLVVILLSESCKVS